jgi:WD40 repeat protein
LRIWAAAEGFDVTSENELKGHTGSPVNGLVSSVAVLESGKIVSGSWDKTLRIWDSNGTCERVLEGHTDFVESVAVLESGKIVSGSRDKTVRIWAANGTSNGCLKATPMLSNVSLL